MNPCPSPSPQLTLPFQLCFDVSLSGGWLTIEFLVDVIFLVDVAMNFRTGYVEKQRDEVRTRFWILRNLEIWKPEGFRLCICRGSDGRAACYFLSYFAGWSDEPIPASDGFTVCWLAVVGGC